MVTSRGIDRICLRHESRNDIHFKDDESSTKQGVLTKRNILTSVHDVFGVVELEEAVVERVDGVEKLKRPNIPDLRVYDDIQT